MLNEEKTITINGTKYVRADQEPQDLNGMKYAIVRSRNQGVMCGYVESINGQVVILHQARQIWRYDSRFVLPDVAEYGMRNPENAKLSCIMTELCVMTEACGVLYCTEIARVNLVNTAAQDKS